MRTAKTLIRLGGHSFCWFCHVAAHIYYSFYERCLPNFCDIYWNSGFWNIVSTTEPMVWIYPYFFYKIIYMFCTKLKYSHPQTRRRIVSWKFWNIFQPKSSPVGFTIYDKFCTPHQLIFNIPQLDTFIFKWFNHCVISLHHSYFISTAGIANL